MTRTYTLHVPGDAVPGEAGAFDRAQLVRDGFSWGAFLFTGFWFMRHRLWLLGLGLLVALFAIGLLLRFAGLPAPTVALIGLCLSLLVGLESGSLRSWGLARKGQPPADVVIAADRAEAELKLISRWLSPREAGLAPGSLAAAPVTRAYQPVLGLFPDAEGRQ